MPKRDNETVTEYTIRRMRDAVLEEAVSAAQGGIVENEPGEYARGRLAAAADVRSMISGSLPE